MTFLRPERGVRPGGQTRQTTRLIEEVRLLRQQTGGGQMSPWLPLAPSLTPGYSVKQGDGSPDVTDATRPTWPRWRFDALRVYLGGAVWLDLAAANASVFEDGAILDGFPLLADIQQEILFMEDQYYSATSTPPQTGFVLNDTLRIGSGSQTYPDGLVLPLDHISFWYA